MGELVIGYLTLQVVLEQSNKQSAFLMMQREEIENCQPHDLPKVKVRHKKETTELDEQFENQLRVVDQEIILELDQLVSEQQLTLHQAAVPFFKITNSPQEIQMQAYILSFVQKLNSH